MTNFKNINPKDLENILRNNSENATAIIDIDKVVDLAIEVWRLRNRLKKYDLPITDDQTKIIDNSFERINRFFNAYEIQIKDYTNTKYVSELNIDPISFESDQSLEHPTIIDTIEPQVSIANKLYRKSKVVIGSP
jgi:hypothetical protein